MNEPLILNGNCLNELKQLPDDFVDSIVTDPPYGLKFMGKKWDYEVPSVELWREALRVLKPGGHLLSFGGTRTYHRMVVNIEDAGFEIRDCIQWLYGSGFPKSHNLEGAHEGWGTALKPANEPIVLARKPLEAKLTIAVNVLKYGTGALNIDASRICFNNGDTTSSAKSAGLGAGRETANLKAPAFGAKLGGVVAPPHSQGRWPANILLDEEAAQALDIQADMNASRFFYVAKASKSERNKGLEAGQNVHPTVKPIKLMQYLVKLVTPPNGIVLDPFMGSGTTGVACVRLGLQFIGCEMDQDYIEIAEKRIASASEE
jgi:DNA modification methylase